MKTKDVETGRVYVARVGRNITRVLVREIPKRKSQAGWTSRKSRKGPVWLQCTNLATGREVSMPASRLRKLAKDQDTRTDKARANEGKCQAHGCERKAIGARTGGHMRHREQCYYHLHPHSGASDRARAGLYFTLRFLDWAFPSAWPGFKQS